MHSKKIKKSLLKLFVFSELMCALYILYYHEYVSDYLNVEANLDDLYVMVFFCLILFAYLFYYYSWSGLTFIFERQKKLAPIGNVNILFFIFVVIYLIFVMKTGVGKVNASDSASANDLSIFDKLLFLPVIALKVNYLIYIYAAGCRNKNKLYYVTIVLFLICELYRGVSFSILLLAVIEIDKWRKYIRVRNLIVTIPFFLLFVNIVYNLKFMVRLGDGYEYLNVYQTLVMLMGRLSVISNILYNYENYTAISNFVSINNYNVANEFLEKLTPMPSVFGIHEKTIEFGKLIFWNSYGRPDSAIAVSILGMLAIVPAQAATIIVTLVLSILFIKFTISLLDKTEEQDIVAFFFVLLTLYQGFWGILANYVYALFVYLALTSLKQLLSYGGKNV
ncbi:oligosaccharide repeat unit polymerase [Enterobacter cloacae]|uniref:oligosaccharide repeat unit polymerase n=1 Tax=Enterobacter cloacae TaxID=550 RepID=UPI003CEF26B1